MEWFWIVLSWVLGVLLTLVLILLLLGLLVVVLVLAVLAATNWRRFTELVSALWDLGSALADLALTIVFLGLGVLFVLGLLIASLQTSRPFAAGASGYVWASRTS